MSVLSNKADLTVFVLIIYAARYLSYFAASFFMPLPTNFFSQLRQSNRIISFFWSSSLDIIIWIYPAVQPSYPLPIVSDLAYTSANYAKLGMSRRFQNLLSYISECK
jgi:hypothetical protein